MPFWGAALAHPREGLRLALRVLASTVRLVRL
jgi:hypothetical protein